MPSLASDLKYAAREMRRRPGFTLTAVLSLALGVGATTAVFSVIYAVLINPFPYGGADRMAQLSLKDKAGKYRFPGLEWRTTGAGSAGQKHRKRRRGGWVESHHHRWRPS